MQTRTYKIKANYAWGILEYLEKIHAIIPVVSVKKTESKTKLSDLLVGSIPKKHAAKLHKQIEQIRSEWERNIF